MSDESIRSQKLVYVGAGPEGLKDAKLVHSMILENVQYEQDAPIVEWTKDELLEVFGPEPFVSVEIVPNRAGAGIEITSDDYKTADQLASVVLGAVRMLAFMNRREAGK